MGNVQGDLATAMGTVTSSLEDAMGNVAGAFDELSRKIDTAFGGHNGEQSERQGPPGPNLLSGNFHHAVYRVTEFLTVEECFRTLALDKAFHSFLSSHSYTWRVLFQRLCTSSGEQSRFQAEVTALRERNLSPHEEVAYLQQRILLHVQDRLQYEARHFRALLSFNKQIYQYCKKFRPSGQQRSHGFFGMSSNLFRFRTRALSQCLSLVRKNAARVCVMDTIADPPAFKRTLSKSVYLDTGSSSVSYLTLDTAALSVPAEGSNGNDCSDTVSDGDEGSDGGGGDGGGATREGRKRVGRDLTLRRAREVVRAVEQNLFQSPLTLPDLRGVPGFIGYATKLCEVRAEHEEVLRTTVCWTAFMHLAVFESHAHGAAFAERLPPAAEEKFWYCGLDYTPPAERAHEARYQRGFNFAYGDHFRPLMKDMVKVGQTPEDQLASIERTLHSLNEALELSRAAAEAAVDFTALP